MESIDCLEGAAVTRGGMGGGVITFAKHGPQSFSKT